MQLVKDFAQSLKTLLPTAAVRPAMGKDYQLPAAIYQTRNGMRDLFYKDSFGMRQTEFVVTIYSKSYTELQDLKTLVTDYYHGFSGVLGSSTVSKMEITNILDGYTDDLETIHRSTLIINATD